jgi:uncharacterized protein (TIGR03000 family)
MRPLLLPSLIAAALLLLASVEAPGQNTGTATIVVRVPADAQVYIFNQLTQQTGTTRSFVTPAVELGRKYSYDIRAEVMRQGQLVSQTQHITFQAGQRVEVDFSNLGAVPPPAEDAAPGLDAGWPRKISRDGNTITIYQPQIEKWEGNRLQAQAAVSVETPASPQAVFGIIWVTARTDVDKEQRLVTLDDFRITQASFPTAAEKGADYLAALRKAIPDHAQTVVALDRLEANLAVSEAETRVRKQPIKNDVPRIIFSKEPALLVLIDGPAAMRQLSGTKFLRAINTRAFLLLDEASGKYYLRLMDRWMEAKEIEGPWAVAKAPPASLDDALQKAKDANLPVDLFDDPAPDIKAEMEAGKTPPVYVSTTPAELIDTQGEPQLAPIEGTKLLWVKNSSDQIVFDIAGQDYYVLVGGRWFRAKDLAKGPWEFVPGDKLPADFAKIPEEHPKGDVLAAVAGTPQAKESLIANNIPQTATIRRKDAQLAVTYDGDPQFEPIADTPLRYAANTPTPVIQTDANSYYACENGVWFNASTPAGPWAAAPSVPPVIYTIPPSSPVYYVTNCYIYDATPDYIYCGYTPGYFGTCVAPWGGVVWGTGWYYRPWIGRWWYGRPWTYGFGAHFGWSAGGWAFGLGAGVGRPWWGPIGWNRGWGGAAWRPGWETGYGGRYANLHNTTINFNNFNAYNRWGNNVRVNSLRNDQLGGRRTTAINTNIAERNVLPRGLNNVYAGRDGNVYRRTENAWEQHTGTGWQNFRPESLAPERRPEFDNYNRYLDNNLAARRSAELNANRFQARGGFGGVTGGFSGYHAPTGFRGGGGFHGGRR